MLFNANIICLSVLINFVYPAALTAGNVYILGAQIKGVKCGLGTQMYEMKGGLTQIKGELKEIRNDIRSLLRRQTEHSQNMARLEKLAMDCCKNR